VLLELIPSPPGFFPQLKTEGKCVFCEPKLTFSVSKSFLLFHPTLFPLLYYPPSEMISLGTSNLTLASQPSQTHIWQCSASQDMGNPLFVLACKGITKDNKADIKS
jgi:hypothetical protein